MNNLKFCIVGLGRAGQFHLKSINDIQGVELKYVVDPNISKEAAKLVSNNVIVMDTIDEALKDQELDAVIVSSPTQFHFDYIIRSLNGGKHVFTEKPLGKTVQEISQCFDLAHEKQLCLFLGFQRRYDQNFQALKQSINEIGKPRTIKTSSRDNPKPSLEYLKISGNIFHDMLIHDFDMLLFLLGEQIPDSVYSVGHAYDPDIEAIQDFDTVMVTLKFPDGLVVSIDTSRTAAYGYDQRIEIFGEHGMSIAENERNDTIELHNSSGMLKSPVKHSFPQRYKESYAKEIEHFAQGILNNELNNISKNECLIAHLFADAAFESIRTGKAIDFREFYYDSLKEAE